MAMKKIILTSLLVLSRFFSFSQESGKSNLTQVTAVDPIDIMFCAFEIQNESGFPSNAFSLNNAENYINQSKEWIDSNSEKFKAIIKGQQGAPMIMIRRSAYIKLHATKQEELKNWLNGIIGKYLQSQEPYQIDATKRFVLSKEDFEKLGLLYN